MSEPAAPYVVDAPVPKDESDREFAAAVEQVLKATKAIDEWERAHGKILDKPIRIACPCCSMEEALRFVRTRYHLYVECETPKCLPPFRGSTRGCR